MQVVGAVGFQGKRLDLENNKICPEMKELLKRCFSEKIFGKAEFSLECCKKTKEIAHLIHEKKTMLWGCEMDEEELSAAPAANAAAEQKQGSASDATKHILDI